MMKVLVCILNWRTPEMTARSLAHVVSDVRNINDARVMVVDNNSKDGSLAALEREVTRQQVADVVDVVPSGHNGGFGFGNNVAIRRGLFAPDKPDYFYLLNSDAFIQRGALVSLVDFMDAHRRVGVAGSVVRDLRGCVEATAFRFPDAFSEFERCARLSVVSRVLASRRVPLPVPVPLNEDVDWVAGSSMILRRTMLEEVGLFDERFFLYYEETDLCLRARRAGWDVAYVRDASVVHVGGASTGVQHRTRVDKPMPRYVFEARRHYFLKNHGRGHLWAANAAHLIAGGAYRLRRALLRTPDSERPHEWRDQTVFNLMHP